MAFSIRPFASLNCPRAAISAGSSVQVIRSGGQIVSIQSHAALPRVEKFRVCCNDRLLTANVIENPFFQIVVADDDGESPRGLIKRVVLQDNDNGDPSAQSRFERVSASRAEPNAQSPCSQAQRTSRSSEARPTEWSAYHCSISPAETDSLPILKNSSQRREIGVGFRCGKGGHAFDDDGLVGMPARGFGEVPDRPGRHTADQKGNGQ